ncbi:MAG: beta strand repeat-containing protein, partial [Dolichospermum sp.]
FAAGSSTATVTVDPTADTAAEIDETIILTLASGTGYTIGTTSGVTGTITNDDLPNVTLSLTSPSTVTEDGPQNLFYVFSRTGDTTNSLTVNFNVSGSATFNNDYVQRGASSFGTTTGSVTFAAGSRVFILSLDPSSDVVSDGNETVALTLAAGTGYAVGTSGAVTGTILDNDVAPGTVVRGSIAKSRNDRTRHEHRNNYAFAALKSDGSVVTWGFLYYGENSSSVSSSLTSGVTQIFSTESAFAALKSDGSVVTWGDSRYGGNSSSVSSSLTSGVTQIFSNDYAFAALKSDGSVVTWGDSTNGGNSSSVSSQLSSGVTQIFSTLYAFAALKSDGSVVTWGDSGYGVDSSSVSSQLTSGVVSFADPFNDDRLVPSSTPFIYLAVSPTSVTEDGTSNLIYTFSRTGSTANTLLVNYTIGGTATNGSDYGTIGTSVTFAAGSSTATVTVDPTGDTTPEDHETVALTLASGTGYNIGTTTAVTGTILDNDTIVTLAVSPTSVTEDGTTNLIYTFTRNGITSNALTVNYTIGGTATNGNDYSSIGSSVTFAAGSSTATVTVDPTSDTTGEADETVTLTLASGTGYTIGTSGAVTGTITNDDLPTITLAVSPTSVTEDGTSNLIYTFSRTGSTANTLLVNYTIGGTATNGIDYSTIGTSVTFAAGSSTATVTVDPSTDTTPEDHETVSLTLAAGTGYNIGTTTAVTGTILDNDTIVTLAVAPASVTEDGTTNLVYTFTRNGFTSNALTVNFTIGGTAINGNDYSSIGSSVTFAAGSSTATVTVDPTADTAAEIDETIILTLASGTGYTIGTTSGVTGT